MGNLSSGLQHGLIAAVCYSSTLQQLKCSKTEKEDCPVFQWRDETMMRPDTQYVRTSTDGPTDCKLYVLYKYCTVSVVLVYEYLS